MSTRRAGQAAVSRTPTDAAVADDGVTLTVRDDLPVDVLFAGRRVGSFWSVRDTEPATTGSITDDTGRRLWPWPDELARRLSGRAEVSLAVHGAEAAFWSGTVEFGGVAEPLELVDRRGNPLALDKSNRLVNVFESRDATQVQPLLDSIAIVIDALRDAGIDPFLAYGTLLGAVREQDFIGHDSDADLGYVSAYDHPADICAESFALQRRLVAAGFEVFRYSGGAFKVVVAEADGARRGLDVFSGFLRDGRLYLMGEVGTSFEPAWIRPLSTARLQDRTYPVPAEPERLLEAMYGASWRVPDPAYKFETPRSTTRRLNGWFRGTRVGQESLWGPHWATARINPRRSSFAEWVIGRLRATDTVVDLGCGTGTDVLGYAKEGHRALGLDYVRRAYARRIGQAHRRGLPAEFDHLNLTELRSVAATTAHCAQLPGRVVLTARHLFDVLGRTGRDNALRMARSLLSQDGGQLHLQVWIGPSDGAPHGVRPVPYGGLLDEVRGAGGTLRDEELRTRDGAGTAGVVDGTRSQEARIARWVVEWT